MGIHNPATVTYILTMNRGKKFLLNTLFVGPKNNSNETSRRGGGMKK